jgi:glycosyltransferase involved in cell wall biosynthesis
LEAVDKSKAKDSIKVITGSFTPERYDKILSSFDLMVLPYSRASQSGNLAHSLALGVPVVATAMEGLKAEVEASKAGIAVPPEDDFELEQAIVRLMKNDKLLDRYAKRASKYVTKQIQWSIVAKKHVTLYDKLVKELEEICKARKKEGCP